MSRFRIDHPTRKNIHAEAGHDPVLSYFVDVMKGHRVVKSYDHFNPTFNRARPLLGCLDFLVDEGFFTAGQLEAVLIHLQGDGPAPSSGVMRIVEIVSNFKS